MMQSLLENIEKDKYNQKLRVIVLAAEGPVFSAGHNLKELAPESGRPQHEKVFQLASKLMYSIIDSPVPIVAQINGLAAAAGCQLVAQCDIVVCTEHSKFSTPGANFGIFCSTPGIPLARKVQKSTALNMLLTGLPISAAEALKSGLVTKVCALEDLESEVDKICQEIMAKSRSVIAVGKRFYYRQVELDIKKAYELGANQMVENLQMADGKEGVRSFVEKRKPIWTHKNE
ncbi:enoyl-CoA hydratase domain-containing protein 3, mitochondrial isoform X2 [Anoplophora glabripennis]|nr:enoyl-CoA hydratase domain-containing protein 3, mitochondrial isoform X2 [Anoplophora glabripennis]